MLDNIFKAEEKTDEVAVAPVVTPTQVTPAPVGVPTATPTPSAVKTAPVTCANCEDSGFSCSVCGYNKP